MIRPTARTLGLVALGLPLAAAPTILADVGWWPFWLAFVAVAAALLLVEFALLPGRRFLAVDVAAPSLVCLGDREHVSVRAAASRGADVELLLTLVGDVEPLPPAVLRIEPGRETTLELPLRPTRRGIVRIVARHARWSGPLGLLRCEIDESLDLSVAVVPNVRAVRQRALQMVAKREFQTGLRVERYVGDGSEFESLREFVTGMDRRAVDWKASARHRMLLCREFRAERDHMVVLCLDTGRLMREPLDGVPRLDHAIHAALQLGYVCLRTGDRVGMHAFADAPQQFVAPQAGVHALQAMQDRMAGLQYGTLETNYTLGMTDLLQRLRRRSLVVLFTDFVDSVTAELMLRNVRWLAQRHLLLFVAMRDPLLDELARHEPDDLAAVHRAVVAQDMRRERQLVLERIRRAGAQVLDAGVDELAPGLVDRYLMVKRRELV